MRFRAVIIFATLLASVCSSQQPSSKHSKENLSELTLEELMSIKVEVVSASKKTEVLSQAPAAIFVLTAEDIRRGGFSSIPEALRMVPGLYVAKVNQRWWTISARGFSDYLNNKMLVLVDGRSVYTPQFGGVYWDIQDLPLEDVERIEVIRGPGGTLWGDNAVNGVINITTKHSRDTQGVSVVTSAGINEGYVASLRYGGRFTDGLTYRVFGKTNYWEPGVVPLAEDGYDRSNLSQGGLRMDWKISDKNGITVDGAGYRGGFQNESVAYLNPTSGLNLLRQRASVRGGHVLSRWTHTFSARSSTDLLGYCDWTDRVSFATEARNTCSVELQHDFKFHPRHSLIWGGGVLTTDGRAYDSFAIRWLRGGSRNTVISGFAQYDFAIIPGRLRLIAGSKFERNSFTGFEIQPQVRGVWTPHRAHTLWAGVSRAVRTPSQLERSEIYDLTPLPAPVPTFLAVTGSTAMKSEILRAYEMGYRFEPIPAISVDASIFYNHYDNLSNVNLVDPMSVAGPPIVHLDPLYIEVPVPWQNIGTGQTHGAEVYVKVRPVKRWMLATGITELRGNSNNLNDTLNLPVANTSKHQFNIQSRLNLTSQLELDSGLYHYNGIPGYRFGSLAVQDVPTHNRFDLGMSFHPSRDVTLSIWGHDLAADPHWENRPVVFTTSNSEVQRSLSFRLSWQSAPEL